jgi:beta-galactosidase
MRSYLFTTALLFFCLCSLAQHKTRVSFNSGWKFKLDSIQSFSDANVDDASWRVLNLPHDWSVEERFDKNAPAGTGGGALPGGIGWYRKTFAIPASQKDKVIFIGFDGVYKNGEVFINGHSLGVRPYGYSSFQYDLTPYLKYGNEKNVVAVKVDNSKQPNSRWYSGSGIYRNVWLTTLDKTHIDNWGTYITTPEINSKEAVVAIQTKVVNGSDANTVLLTTIYDASGKKVVSSTKNADNNTISQSVKIPKPKLWSVEQPYLYKVVSQLKSGTVILDEYTTPLGIRFFYFDREKGFSLNGKRLKILGVCNHHDLGALGAAINTRALERQLQILKDMGCNGIRTSHNPPAPELLDLCDKMGFIVMDEAFDMWAKAKNKFDYHLDWDAWHEKDLSDFIVRDRNHPSVMIWSIGNEIIEQWGDVSKGDTSGRMIARELAGIVRSLDNTRPITSALNNTEASNHIFQSGALDLVGFNYAHQKWGDFLNQYPGQRFIVTESTSALETRGHYDLVPFDTIRRWPYRWDQEFKGGNPELTVSAYDNVSTPWGSTHEESIKPLLKFDHVSGMYIWTGFDYLGEPTPYPWPARSSYFGIIDLAGFPKDVYYLYQSVFTNKPVLHIYPHWNWKQGDTVDVVAYYNNADKVELFLNGKSLGSRTKKGEELHVKWRVPYAPGTLKAVAKKSGKTVNGDKTVLVKEIKTAGEAYQLSLKADRSTITADGKDLSFVTVEVRDKNGVLVPNAKDLIKFSISGEGFIAGVDNGDPVSMESFKSNQHTALNGKALCIVQSNGSKGNIKLTASAGGLQSSTIQIVAQ